MSLWATLFLGISLASGLQCDFSRIAGGPPSNASSELGPSSQAPDPLLVPLLEAAEVAVQKKRPFGVEIEFLGSPLKVAEALTERYGGTLDRTARIDRVVEGEMEKYDLGDGRWIRIDHEQNAVMGAYQLTHSQIRRPHFFKSLGEAKKEAAEAFPDLPSASPSENRRYFYAIEVSNGSNDRPHRFIWENNELKGERGFRKKMTLEEAKTYMEGVRTGDVKLESQQVFYLRGTEFGDITIKSERDGYWEVVTDHRTYQPPEAFQGLLETLYGAGARGTSDTDAIGIHVNVASNPSQVPLILGTWEKVGGAFSQWAHPHGQRYRYLRPIKGNYESLLGQSLGWEQFNQRLLETLKMGRESDLNVYELANGKKDVTEVRLFNTEDPHRLPTAIRLSLGLVEWSAQNPGNGAPSDGGPGGVQ